MKVSYSIVLVIGSRNSESIFDLILINKMLLNNADNNIRNFVDLIDWEIILFAKFISKLKW